MLHRIAWLSVVLLAACGGDTREDEGPEVGAPAISAVYPATVLIARTTQVTISGYVSNWTGTPVVSLGGGVTVKSVALASPNAIIATIEVAPDAEPGPRNVSVTAGGRTLTYTGGFALAAPVEVKSVGSVAQGSVATLKFVNLDLKTPFDTTATGGGLFSNPVFTNVAIKTLGGEDAAGVRFAVQDVQAYIATIKVYIDVTTAAGPQTLDLLSGPAGAQDHFPFSFDVAARSPVVVAAGTPAAARLNTVGDTALLSYTAGAEPQILEMLFASTDEEAMPAAYLLPASGKFADALAGNDSFLFQTDASATYYLVVLDLQGGGGYDFTLGAEVLAPTSVAGATNNTTGAAAQVLAAGAAMVTGNTLPADDAERWYKITVPAGKRIHAATIGDDLTDTVIDVWDTATPDTDPWYGDEPVASSGDNAFQETLLSEAISGGGTFWLRVSAGYEWSSAHKGYTLIVAYP